jgi:hypothetical protein
MLFDIYKHAAPLGLKEKKKMNVLRQFSKVLKLTN